MRVSKRVAVMMACAAVPTLFGLYLLGLRIVESLRWHQLFGDSLLHFDASRMVPYPWMVDRWFVACVLFGGILLEIGCLNLALPPERRYRFHVSHLRVGLSFAVRSVVGLLWPRSILHGFVLLTIPGSFITTMAGDSFGLQWMETVGVGWFVSGLYLFPVVWLGTKEPVLFVGAVPATALWVLFVVVKALTVPEGDRLIAAFALIMVWYIPLVVWALATFGLYRFARVSKTRSVLGSLTDLAASSFLMVPWMLAAFILPQEIYVDNQTFTIIASIVVALLWGKVIAEPFAKLVHALRERPTNDEE